MELPIETYQHISFFTHEIADQLHMRQANKLLYNKLEIYYFYDDPEKYVLLLCDRILYHSKSCGETCDKFFMDPFKTMFTETQFSNISFLNRQSQEKQMITKQININKSFLEQDSVILNELKNHYDTGYDFGNKESNYKSLLNWIVYIKILYTLSTLKYEENIELKKELDRAVRHLELIEWYLDGRDYGYCLSGIWSMVSVFNFNERKYFLEALESGDLSVPKDEDLLYFLKSLD
uniref:Uncharacterized protein n=1 Tax=viral metagenome TaxID=1070528 RepID=A0A6C0C972_9ZZZZ